MSIKSLIKKCLPEKLKNSIGGMLIHHREQHLGRLSLSDAFDQVYARNMWKQGVSRSGIGSEGIMADRYVDLVLRYAATNGLRTVVDGGCGDFSVGSRLASGFAKYTAIDVSPHIIEVNKRRYSELAARNVTFNTVDMTSTPLPPADLVLIRQVLQHLPNPKIEQILGNLEASNWRRALITEHVHNPGKNEIPNLDLPSHTVRTRVSLGSGVFIDRAPFNRLARRMAYIEDEPTPTKNDSGLVVFELVREVA